MAKRRSKKRGVAFTTDADVPKWGASKKTVKANQAERDHKNVLHDLRQDNSKLTGDINLLENELAQRVGLKAHERAHLEKILAMPVGVAVAHDLVTPCTILRQVLDRFEEADLLASLRKVSP